MILWIFPDTFTGRSGGRGTGAASSVSPSFTRARLPASHSVSIANDQFPIEQQDCRLWKQNSDASSMGIDASLMTKSDEFPAPWSEMELGTQPNNEKICGNRWSVSLRTSRVNENPEVFKPSPESVNIQGGFGGPRGYSRSLGSSESRFFFGGAWLSTGFRARRMA